MRNKHTDEIDNKRHRAYDIGDNILLAVLVIAMIVITLTKYLTS